MQTLPDNGERYHIIRKTYFPNVISYIIEGLTVSQGKGSIHAFRADWSRFVGDSYDPCAHFCHTFCQLPGATGSAAYLMDKARSNLIAIAFGMPAMNAVQVMTAFMTIDNDDRLSVISSIVLTAVNIVLDYIVLLRDDCQIFDPVKQLQLYDKNVPLHHMGLWMVIASARDVRYTTILDLNNLVIRI